MWTRGLGQWYLGGDSGGVDVAPQPEAAFFQRYPARWSGQVALGHLFRPPPARWSGRLTSNAASPWDPEVPPHTKPPDPDPLVSKIGSDVTPWEP